VLRVLSAQCSVTCARAAGPGTRSGGAVDIVAAGQFLFGGEGELGQPGLPPEGVTCCKAGRLLRTRIDRYSQTQGSGKQSGQGESGWKRSR
jgi:hypothetical protein